jgi:hypothetical protein
LPPFPIDILIFGAYYRIGPIPAIGDLQVAARINVDGQRQLKLKNPVYAMARIISSEF